MQLVFKNLFNKTKQLRAFTAMKTNIGVIAIQGDVAEHVIAFEKTLAESGENGEVVKIKQRGIVGSCDATVIPGGESTTIQVVSMIF